MTALWIGTRKGLFKLVRVDTGWTVEDALFLGDRVSALAASSDGSVLHAALDLGHFGAKMRRSTDGGRTWTEVATPEYPPKPADAGDLEANSQTPVPWNTELIWCLEPGTAANPDRLWCGTIPGGLFRSDDGGDTWQLVRSLWDHPSRSKWFGGGYDYPGIHSVSVHPEDDRRVTVGVSCGGAWHTDDAGETWALATEGMFAAYMPESRKHEPDIQDPHRIVRCPSRPERMWCQHHNGIFLSDDEGRNWRSLDADPSTFGFAVAVHPTDPDTAWFIPAQKDEQRIPVDGAVVVLKTTDGGKSFEPLREGLPQEHAYDSVFRHAFDVTADGRTLAFGSTTGNLWLSEDGSSWSLLTAHLPPIHCLRWL